MANSPIFAPLRLCALALFLLFHAAAFLLATEIPPDLPVARVDVVGDQGEDRARVIESLGIVVGAPLDRQGLREGVHTLFAGGEVEYLKIEARPGEQDVDLLVEIRYRARIAELKVSGVGLVWRRRIADWIELRPGVAVSAAGVEAGARRALAKLRERGWNDAELEPYLEYNRSSNTVDVTVDVDLGHLHRLQSVGVIGLDDSAEIEKVLPEIKAGKRLTRTTIDRLRDEVEAETRRLGYWEAVVAGIDQQVEQGDVHLMLEVAPGSHYRAVVEAPDGMEELVRAALPDPAEAIHPAQTEALAERVRDNLQAVGHLLARVEVELEHSGDHGVLTVLSDPGSVIRVGRVDFPGAEAVKREVLERAVRVRRGRTVGFSGRKVTMATLERDRQALEVLYLRRGFRDAEVRPARLETLGGDEVAVLFPVEEGRRWVLEQLRFEGLPVEAVAVIEHADLGLKQGDAWCRERIDPLCRSLERVLASTGYPNGRVTPDIDESNPGSVRVVVRADSGPFVRVGEVVVSGLKATRPKVVDEVLERVGLVSGESYSHEAIMEAQRELYHLGLFRAVEVVPIPGQERRLVRGLVIRLEEGKQRSILFGVGWDTEERSRLTLGWGHLNLFGGAHAVAVETRISSRQLRFQASLREQSLFGRDVPGYAVAYRTEEELADYSQVRFGTWFEIGDRRRRPFRRWLRSEYQVVEPDAPEEVLSELEREDQRIRLASVTPVFQWDTRDDPLSPKQGFLLSTSAEYAFPLLRAEAEFLKLQASFSLYGSLPHGHGAIGIRLGTIEPLGADTGDPANLQVPLATRFFAGGRTTHRAFSRDRLGIPGETIDEDGKALGGNAVLLVNLEYNRRVWGPLAATLFVDGGNVWSDPGSVALGQMRWGVGLGLRYETPAGPMRIEYGRKLDRESGESKGQFYFSFGVPF